jgi:hypothetical protein
MAKAEKPDSAERRLWEALQRPGFAARYRLALLALEIEASFEARAKIKRKPWN